MTGCFRYKARRKKQLSRYSWNEGTEDQAMARTHRIGQKYMVEVVRVVADGTFDDRMIAIQRKKEEAIKNVLRQV